ncbi:MAG: Sensor histidine kinase TodS [Candidatus Ordinivivax streblomastigis]|uniref:histidine kinase n=1 Tax=Candidatus Ordinivivax streblomastigis TaxID=2540710 RepID=A0A5M8P3G3_9BACT|nr:MAG: Sensor histidine kinase TodS [Candidatus Ordinivivax streblomastigis]
MNTYSLKYLSFVLPLLLLQVTNLAGQETVLSWEIKKVTIKNGLSNDKVNCIEQDYFGFVWGGTEVGLNCFDGVKVKTYYAEAGNPNSLSDNSIQTIYAEKDKPVLWIGTENGLNEYSYQNNSFRQYYFTDENGKRIHNNFSAIIPVNEKTLIVASTTGGIFLFNKEKKEFQWLKDIYTQASHSQWSLNLNSAFLNNQHQLWMATFDKGIYCYNLVDGQLKSFGYVAPYTPSDVNAFSICEDNWGQTRVATSKGVFILDVASGTFVREKNWEVINKNIAYSIKTIGNNELWVGTENGIYIAPCTPASSANNGIKHIEERLDDNGLSFRAVRDLLEDSYGNIWAAIYSGGMNYVIRKQSPIGLLQKKNNYGSPVNSYYCTLSIAEGKDDTLYLGTNGGGVKILHLDTGKESVIRFRTNENELLSNIVQAVYVQNDEILWAGTYRGGLIRYNLKNNSKTIYTQENSLLPRNDVRFIFEDKQHQLWVGTTYGLCRISSEGKIEENYLVGNNLRNLLEDPSGNIWIATYHDGLIRYLRDQNRFEYYTHSIDDANSLPENSVVGMCYTEKQELWIVTKTQGIARFDEQSQQFIRYLLPSNQPHDIAHIVEDNSGNLWIISTGELTRFTPSDGSSQIYASRHILDAGMMWGLAFLKSSKGVIYAGGVDAILYFNPQMLLLSSQAGVQIPPPLITALYINREPLSISNDSIQTPLKTSVLLSNHITLNYNQSNIGFYFVSPVYAFIDDVRYAYRLDGEDTDWNETNDYPYAYYRNLSPGTYTFQVKASTRNGIWTEPTIYTVTIKPPVWLSNWMIALYIALSILIIYGIFRFLLYRERMKNELKIVNLEKANEEEMYRTKIQMFTDISHDLRTPLALISNPVEKLISMEDENNKLHWLYLIKTQSDKLLKHVSQLLDLFRLDRKGQNLHLEHSDIINLLSDVYYSFEGVSLKKILRSLFKAILTN